MSDSPMNALVVATDDISIKPLPLFWAALMKKCAAPRDLAKTLCEVNSDRAWPRSV